MTALGREGKTNGVFFRTITLDALQGVAAAKFAIDNGFKKIVIIHQNNDFGVNLVKEFTDPYKALGGTIVAVTPYNAKQSDYASEVTAAMAGSPDALYLISDPVDGAADRSYDAGALVGLALAIAGGPDASKLPESLRKAVDPKGEVIHAGKEEFAKALALIKAGKPIRYEGVIGPVAFDQYGDIAGPFRLWQIVDGKVTTVGEMTTAEVEAVAAKVK